MPDIRHVTDAELRERITEILTRYPWFADHPVSCHSSCTRWEIAREYGDHAGDAWQDYDTAVWLLTGTSPNPAREGEH